MKEKLENLGISTDNNKLLETALTHSSYGNEKKVENYERLEFLGDAVLELIMSKYLYNNAHLNEGDMSKIRARYVCEEALATYAKDINLKDYIKVGHGQLKDINDTIIADVFEAVLAVIYLEKGFDVAEEYALSLILPYYEKKVPFNKDYKSLLQEMVQTDKRSVSYVVVNEEGPAHDRTFTVEVMIDDIVYGRGIGHSKKIAEQNAARDAYEKSIR